MVQSQLNIPKVTTYARVHAKLNCNVHPENLTYFILQFSFSTTDILSLHGHFYNTYAYKIHSCLFFNDITFQSTDLNTATHVHTELVSDTGFKVQAVLVEEDEEEAVEEHEEDVTQTQPQPCAVTPEPVQTEPEEQEPEEQEPQEEEQKEEKKEQEKEADKEEEEDGLKQEAEDALPEEPVEVVEEEEEAKDDGEQNDQSQDSQCPANPAEISEKEEESAVTGSPLVLLS